MIRLLPFCFLCALPVQAETLGPSISGDARMGLVWESQPSWAGQRETGLRMTSRTRVTLQFLGETDGGLRFGTEITLGERDRERLRLRQFTIGE
ncbi:MAG: hypothetical protein EA407_00200 [Rhodobacteraceae bacterium]|nr:MAG: hypothetical protein EA407_00200 [Paracoccaceae bacterium]